MLICPNCQNKLSENNYKMLCEHCHQEYIITDGITNLIPKSDDKFREIEQEFWDNTYHEEGIRDTENRNSDFHKHFLKPLFRLKENSNILEIASGSRADLLELAKFKNHNIYISDISFQALQNSKKLIDKNSTLGNITYLQADASNLPFSNDSLDAILIAAAFHHLENPKKGLIEIKRVLKNDGILILGVEPNKWPYQTIYALLSPLKKIIRKKRGRKIDSIADDTTKGFSKSDFIKLFNSAGIEILEIKPVKYLQEWYDSYIRLKSRLFKKNYTPSVKMMNYYSKIDKLIEKIPLLNRLNWHWNVIAKVNK